MLGAIIGDIVGSVYEWNNIKTKEFEFFRDDCFFTDDTVMTVAVAEALMNGGEPDDYIEAMKKYGRLYPDAGYGGHFGNWLFSDDKEPYNSWGNGSAMRVSPVAWFYNTLYDVEENAAVCAEVTHNHNQGVRGAQATATAIFLARTGKTKGEIKRYIEEIYKYDLSKTLDDIRPTYGFDVSCQGTVPPAIIAFLESTDFEDAIRNAISLGGDSDTLAAITGSIAEAAYGVPQHIREKVFTYLDKRLIGVLSKFYDFTKDSVTQSDNKEVHNTQSTQGTEYMCELKGTKGKEFISHKKWLNPVIIANDYSTASLPRLILLTSGEILPTRRSQDLPMTGM